MFSVCSMANDLSVASIFFSAVCTQRVTFLCHISTKALVSSQIYLNCCGVFKEKPELMLHYFSLVILQCSPIDIQHIVCRSPCYRNNHNNI